MSATSHLHMVVVQCIIWYLTGTTGRGLFFPSQLPLTLKACSDADWARCPNTRWSTTRWCMFLDLPLASWKCKKQAQVSKSSTEVEYRSVLNFLWNSLASWVVTGVEAFHSHHPLHCMLIIQVSFKLQLLTFFHKHTKHIKVNCHLIREQVDNGMITLLHEPSGLQLAHASTKAMTQDGLRFLISKLMHFKHPHQFKGVQNDGRPKSMHSKRIIWKMNNNIKV